MARARSSESEKTPKSTLANRSVLASKKPARNERATAAAAPARKSRSGASRGSSRRITKRNQSADSVPRPSELIDAQTRWQMIQEAAYYISERQGFQPGSELQNWLKAEAQIDQLLK